MNSKYVEQGGSKPNLIYLTDTVCGEASTFRI
jgi:hypothetical protein